MMGKKSYVIEIAGDLNNRGTPGFDIPGTANTIRRKQYACTPNIPMAIEKMRRCEGTVSNSGDTVPHRIRVLDFRDGQLILEAMD